MQTHNTSTEEPNTTNTNCEEAANIQGIKTLLRQLIPDHRVPDGRNFASGSANRML
jgi:hypothetical protein